jgi:hypothetical protein
MVSRTRTRAATMLSDSRRYVGWVAATSQMDRCRRALYANPGVPSPPWTAWVTATAASVPLARARSGTHSTAPLCPTQSHLPPNPPLRQRQRPPRFRIRTPARELVVPTRLLPRREPISRSRRDDTRLRLTTSSCALAILQMTTPRRTPRRRRTQRRRQKASGVATIQSPFDAGAALRTFPTNRPIATRSDILDG